MIRKPIARKKPRRQAKKKRPRSTPAQIAATIATIDKLKAPTPKAAALFELLKGWLQDESGYDEEALPALKKALDEERDRVGARRLFDG